LVSGKEDPDGLAINQTSFEGFESFVEPAEAGDVFESPEEDEVLPAAEKPARYDEWYYLDREFGLILQGRRGG
jgi:inorganic pyrophosphatase